MFFLWCKIQLFGIITHILHWCTLWHFERWIIFLYNSRLNTSSAKYSLFLRFLICLVKIYKCPFKQRKPCFHLRQWYSLNFAKSIPTFLFTKGNIHLILQINKGKISFFLSGKSAVCGPRSSYHWPKMSVIFIICNTIPFKYKVINCRI